MVTEEMERLDMDVLYVLLILLLSYGNSRIIMLDRVEEFAKIKISSLVNKILFLGAIRERGAYFDQEKKKIRSIPVQKVPLYSIVCQCLQHLLVIISVISLLLNSEAFINIQRITAIRLWIGDIQVLFALSIVVFIVNVGFATIFGVINDIFSGGKISNSDKAASIYARRRLKAIADERAWKFGLQSGQEWDKEGFLHQKENDKVDSVAALMSLAYYIGDDPLQIGHTGEPVAALQSFLGLPVTGNFDEVLESSVKQVQKKLELPETGIFDGLIIDTLISLLTREDADLTRKAEKEARNNSHRFDRQTYDVMILLLVAIVIGLLIASYRLPD